MRVLPNRTRLSTLLVLLVALGAAAPAAHAAKTPLSKPTWVSKVTITEYYPAPEWWFVGAAVDTPGLARKSRVDWLYSARGMSMQGEGVGMDGQSYHIDAVGSSGWITARARAARFGVGGIFAPFWRGEGYWLSRAGSITFPLLGGGWYDGRPAKHVPVKGITFAKGRARPLVYYRSLAVDPTLIPLGSLVYVPAYKPLNKDGWFRAEDTGGAIKGRHIDVYRRPPDSPADSGRFLTARRIFVVPKEDIAAYVKRARASAGALPPIPARLRHAPR